MKRIIITLMSLIRAACSTEPNIDTNLHIAIIFSNDLSPESKIGLDQIDFWKKIHAAYSGQDTRIPELTKTTEQLISGAKLQISRYYELDTSTKFIANIDKTYSLWQQALKGESPTLIEFYDLLVRILSVPNSHEHPFGETIQYAKKILDLGVIVAPIFPTTDSTDFDGQLGYAAVTAGLSQNVWLAGVSFRPDLIIGNYFRPTESLDGSKKVSPNLFLWYQIAADGYYFIINSQYYKLSDKLKNIRSDLAVMPTPNKFDTYFNMFRKNNF